MRRIIRMALVFCLCGQLLYAAKFWEKKPYSQWNEKEARELLKNSPWVSECMVPLKSSRTSRQGGVGPMVRIAIFSSHAVRQAYAVVASQKDPALQERLKGFVEREYNDEIVISVSVASGGAAGASGLQNMNHILSSLSTAAIRNETALSTGSGRRVFLKRYEKPKDNTGAKFVFPRTLEDGTPLFGPGDKDFKFGAPVADTRIFATFKVKDLMLLGQADF